MKVSEFEIPPSFQEHTGPMMTYLQVKFAVPEAPIPSDCLVDDDMHMELQKRALQILFLPRFQVSDHIFRDGVAPSNTRDGFPTVRSAEISGDNFSLEVANNFNYRRASAHMSMNGMRRVIAVSWSSRVGVEESRLDTATASWFQIDVLERVLSEVMSMPRDSK